MNPIRGAMPAPGEQASFRLLVSSSYTGSDIYIPVVLRRGLREGPTVLVCGAVHGDEINGTGSIRHLITHPSFELAAGLLVLVPVANILGFERHSRYLPDRRDLNRCFPGSQRGSLSSRLARSLFDQIVRQCQYAIDLHSAAIRRTNYPNIRADLQDQRVAELARAFGAEIIVAGRGPKGSLRRAASEAGCPTIVFEAGEVWKVEPMVVKHTIRGVRNCLIALGMVEGDPEIPEYQLEADTTHWVRARLGGFLQFHVGPGAVVTKGTPLATNTSLMGQENSLLRAPRGGVVLGMTTLPAVAPGDPVCHLAYGNRRETSALEKTRDNLHLQATRALARNVMITEPTLPPIGARSPRKS